MIEKREKETEEILLLKKNEIVEMIRGRIKLGE
jgi:hypothetical protein